MIPAPSAPSAVCVLLGDQALPDTAGKAEATSRTIDGETFVGIRNVNAMPPFLMSIVSNGDLWLFAGSNAPFTAGRGDADHALFPYRTADRILGQADSSGARSIFLVERAHGWALWEPWQQALGPYRIQRSLFKSEFGTSVIFEEVNVDLGLRFASTLTTSEAFGLVRFGALENLSRDRVRVRYLDGWHQLIPAGVGQELLEKYSYLAAAYMRHEGDQGLGVFTLNSGITDRAEPCESLRVATAWSIGHDEPTLLLCQRQVDNFRRGQPVHSEREVRGEFGAHLVGAMADLPAGATHEWIAVADTGLDHGALARLRRQLASPAALRGALLADVVATREGLRARIASADGLQQTANTAVSVHHFANVLFNCMRGGTLPDGYRFPSPDFAAFLRDRNADLHARQAPWLATLPPHLELAALRQLAVATGDPQLIRLASEYLPLTFSRRHGDPSRPWNRFAIRTRDEHGETIYDYQGNWRDIFQNWESLAQSYPLCLESMVAVFLNASTADGYNPYRITRSGIDWEVEDPQNPWSHIGYWGDHQIVYLLRLLESYEHFEPGALARRLNEELFAYALVPYEIKGLDDLRRDPRHSIHFNAVRHRQLLARAAHIGNDGRLHATANGNVLLVSLAEKLLVPLLAKLSNLVPGGGIWLNTQRPEWNDANNALAGWGLSVVTVAYLRRYLAFLAPVFGATDGTVVLSTAVARFAEQLRAVLSEPAGDSEAERFSVMAALGRAGEQHRQAVYQGDLGTRIGVMAADIQALLSAGLKAVDATLHANRRPDGLFHSYNALALVDQRASVTHLSLMLEGQVAILSSGVLDADAALSLLRALRPSDLFRADQHSYLLYPDRELVPFALRNTLPENWRSVVPGLAALVDHGNRELLLVDEQGAAHFHGDLVNAAGLAARLDRLTAEPEPAAAAVASDRAGLLDLWETVFHHRAFTGRSGSMFAFEGLGSIYWHMVAKLLLAVAETYHRARQTGVPTATVAGLHDAYDDIRRGLGFTKTPEVYGAFPTDPYSHTPRHLGAQQPGMTGQVKEEILTRWAELGVRVEQGALTFAPELLRRGEFSSEPRAFAYTDVNGVGRVWLPPADSLIFTYCQVPVCYYLANQAEITIEEGCGAARTVAGRALSAADSRAVFCRTGAIARLTVGVPAHSLRE